MSGKYRYNERAVFTPEEMRGAERRAFDAGFDALLLMERAAMALTDALEELLDGCEGKRVLFLCGRGNNGGDGLAAARLFADRGGEPAVWLAGEPVTEQAKRNLILLRTRTEAVTVLSGDPGRELPPRERYDAYVDALFGTGFHGEPDPLSRRLMEVPLLDPGVPVISADIPSGLNGETGEAAGEDALVYADVTVTFHAAKRGLYLSPYRGAVGRLVLVDIGLRDTEEPGLIRLDPEDLELPDREPTCHKGDCGRVLIRAGSAGMAGAAAMCARAALKGGAGLVTLACDAALIPVLQTLEPCAMCRETESVPDGAPGWDVLVCGPGMGTGEEQRRQLERLYDPDRPTVLDADALTLIARRPMPLGADTVITPHIGEAARLLGVKPEEVLRDRFSAVRALREKYGCVCVLKSDVTLIDWGEGVRLAACGTPALAKGGSGDVLCGLIAALLAQTGDPSRAASMGVLWHALAGRVGERRFGRRELTARELTDCLRDAEEAAETE